MSTLLLNRTTATHFGLAVYLVGGVVCSFIQVKECASRLVRLAKGSGVTVFIVGHVTKSGSIAGPKVVEHMVDTVLYLEGDRFNSYRYRTTLTGLTPYESW